MGEGIPLRAWHYPSATRRRGTVVYLHGLSDNRGSSLWLAQHLTGRGFDVLAYDSRAHGDSGGDACSYGFHEKRDLARVLDALENGPFLLLGNSMGAAVALQAAADDPRIAGVVSVATISDLRTAALERAPFFARRRQVEEALAMAEHEGRFRVADVSPVAAASRIRCPVFLIHGQDDKETPADHSRRVFAALTGPRRLNIVPGAGHNDALNARTWPQVDAWMDSIVPP